MNPGNSKALGTAPCNGIFPPDEGWESLTYYLVEVSFQPNHLLFEVIFRSGFIVEEKKADQFTAFGAHSMFLDQQINGRGKPYYMKAIGKMKAELFEDTERRSLFDCRLNNL